MLMETSISLCPARSLFHTFEVGRGELSCVAMSKEGGAAIEAGTQDEGAAGEGPFRSFPSTAETISLRSFWKVVLTASALAGGRATGRAKRCWTRWQRQYQSISEMRCKHMGVRALQ